MRPRRIRVFALDPFLETRSGAAFREDGAFWPALA